jgi:outer membrane protein
VKKLVLALIAAAAASTSAMAAPAAGDIVARVRAVQITPADEDTVAITDVSVSKKTIPEVDFTYFLSPNLAAELILTYPQKHDVSSSAHGGKIGTLKHLPPTLTLQYHINDFGAVKPYVGAGLNYTNFSKVDLLNGAGDVERGSFGLALQAGVDYKLDSKLSLNFDVKKVQIRTDLSAGGANLGTVKVDPLLVGIGIGYKY